MAESISSSIPKLEHIPILEGSSNAEEWFRSMALVLKAEGVWGHVEGVDDNLAAVWQASYPPALTIASTNAQRQISTTWWIKDSRAVALLNCRLNSISKSLLPVGDEVTARVIWARLKSLYSRMDHYAQFEIRDRLDRNKLVNAADFLRFQGEFETCRNRLASMGAPLSEHDAIMTLLRALPHDSTWPQFKQSIAHFRQNWDDFNMAYVQAANIPFALFNKIMGRLEQECISLISLSKPIQNGPGSEYVNIAIKRSSRNPQGVICSNCKRDNHDFDHCWSKNGGAEGQWPGGPNDPQAKSTSNSTTQEEIAALLTYGASKLAFPSTNNLESDGYLSC